jgi:pimeloyl-ACP methyl ester carboxylesterase
MKKVFLWIGFGLIALVGVVLIGGWLVHKFLLPIPDPSPEVLAKLRRASLPVPAIPGLEISYLSGGDREGPRLVFVHGTPGEATNWSAFLTDPPAGWEAVAPDRPGFGETRPRRVLASLRLQAEVLEPFLIARRGRRPILVGHSLGGAIICRMAADYPGRVGGLVVVAGSLDPALERVGWYQRLARWPGISRLVPSALAKANQEVLGLGRELESLGRLLPDIRCPVVILHGKKDRLVPAANADYLSSRLSGSSRVEVMVQEEQGHFLLWTHRPVVEEALARIIELTSTGPRPSS